MSRASLDTRLISTHAVTRPRCCDLSPQLIHTATERFGVVSGPGLEVGAAPRLPPHSGLMEEPGASGTSWRETGPQGLRAVSKHRPPMTHLPLTSSWIHVMNVP